MPVMFMAVVMVAIVMVVVIIIVGFFVRTVVMRVIVRSDRGSYRSTQSSSDNYAITSADLIVNCCHPCICRHIQRPPIG